MKVTVESVDSYASQPIRVKKVIFEDKKITFVFMDDTTYSFSRDYITTIAINNDVISIETITDTACDILFKGLHIRKK